MKCKRARTRQNTRRQNNTRVGFGWPWSRHPTVTAFCAALVLGGCGLFQRDAPGQPDPGTAFDAGNVHVSAYPAVAWEDVAEQLEPKHNLTSEQARQLAIQTTQSQVFQFLSTFAAGLSIGLPTRTISETTAVAADGTSTTTSTSTRGTGIVPSSSGTPATTVDNAALAADLTKGALAMPTDANTLLTAAHALYQQAKILDNQISRAIVPKGYRAHLLTLQVNLQPLRRDFAYDTYVNVSLMPGSWAETLATSRQFDTPGDDFPAVIFHPLIVTDALETSSVTRTTEIIRQLSLSLSGVVGRVGANLGVGRGTDSLEALFGNDKNTLITLGRVNDSTLRIRIGAHNAGSNRYAMVPRTYNVSLVVLTRSVEAKDRVNSLSVVTRSDFVSSITGNVLPSARDRVALAAQVDRYVSDYGLSVAPTCGSGSRKQRILRLTAGDSGGENGNVGLQEQAATEVGPALQLLRAIDRGDYPEVNRCLNVSEIDQRQELGLRRLLAQLTSIQSASRYATFRVALQPLDDPQLPPVEQLVVARDDKSAVTAQLRGGKSLTGNALSANLKLKNPGRDRVLLPVSLVVSNGSDVTVTFPSLTAIGLTAQDLVQPALEVTLNQAKRSILYDLHWTGEEKKVVGNPLRIDSAVVVGDAQGNGRLSLTMGKMPEGVKGQLRVVVNGADVREDKSVATPAAGPRGISLAANSNVVLSLSNLSPARPVTVSTYADDTKLGELSVPVERVAGAQK